MRLCIESAKLNLNCIWTIGCCVYAIFDQVNDTRLQIPATKHNVKMPNAHFSQPTQATVDWFRDDLKSMTSYETQP